MKLLGSTAKWVFVLCLPLLLISASIGGAVNSLRLYQYGFQKYDISATTGLADAELEKAARGLIGYFNSGEDAINLTVIKDNQPFVLFNEREVTHLKDVKALFRLDYGILLGTLLYASGYAVVSLFWRQRQYRRQLAWGTVIGSGLTLALMLALGLGTLLGFDQLFLQFHLLSFANDFWQLDPARDYLVRLFPQGFWYDATLFCLLAVAAGAAILLALGGWYLLATKNKASAD